ncbi:MAG: anti-sigma factor [Roseiflexaceae bacterium]|nr:anti-sigma factor [Roseiflexaceae bacterium]
MQPESTTMEPWSDDVFDLLTAYALDALEPEEMSRVSELLARDPELQRQYADLRATAALLPHALPDAAPPPELRQKVLDYAVGRAAPQAAPLPKRAELVTRGLRNWLFGLGALAVAAMAVALITLGQLGTVRAELAQAQTKLDQQVVLNKQVAQAIANQNQTVALSGQAGSGTVIVDTGGQFVIAAALPPLPTGRVYQLWVIEGQTPVSTGTFTVDADGVALAALPTRQLPPNALFAITEEPGPDGSSGPTSDVLISNLPPA